LPYYERWMARYPTVEALAQAPLSEVLKLWEGLGYYGRARHLHAAAGVVVAEQDGRLPAEPEALIRLKGIGRYTAAAIASIAYGRPVAAVDGNVIRVLSRLLDIPDDVTSPAVQERLWREAERLLPPGRPGDFNQAMMELGQVICLPALPRCAVCPLHGDCLARQRGTQLERPVRPPRARRPHYQVTAGVIRRADGRFLIAQRPPDGLLGGLWEFPGGKQESGESLEEALRREIHEELGMEIAVGRELVTLDHGYTHFRITLHAFLARHVSGEPRHFGVSDHAWVALDELESYAFAVTDLKIIAQLRREDGRGTRSQLAASHRVAEN
jgi:A/G-specific adenine glycosylase